MASRRRVARRGGTFVPEEEVRRRWALLGTDGRRKAMSFQDAALVGRIRGSLQNLFEKNALMKELGLGSSDEFADASLFMDAFAVPMRVARCTKDPNIMLVDPTDQPGEMHMKEPFLEGEQVFERFKVLLPDILGEKTGRSPMSRALWKDLWAREPTSMEEMDRQLAKLTEQALWLLESPMEPPPAPIADVALEEWMLQEDKAARERKISGKAKKSKKKTKGAAVARLEPRARSSAHSEGSCGSAAEDHSNQGIMVANEIAVGTAFEEPCAPSPSPSVGSHSSVADDRFNRGILGPIEIAAGTPCKASRTSHCESRKSSDESILTATTEDGTGGSVATAKSWVDAGSGGTASDGEEAFPSVSWKNASCEADFANSWPIQNQEQPGAYVQLDPWALQPLEPCYLGASTRNTVFLYQRQ